MEATSSRLLLFSSPALALPNWIGDAWLAQIRAEFQQTCCEHDQTRAVVKCVCAISHISGPSGWTDESGFNTLV